MMDLQLPARSRLSRSSHRRDKRREQRKEGWHKRTRSCATPLFFACALNNMILALFVAQVFRTGVIGFFRNKSARFVMVEHDIELQNTHQVIAMPSEPLGCTVFAVNQHDDIL